MPILAVLGIGALVGLAGYFGYHAIRHFFFHKGWDLSWKGAGASLAAGAVALPAALFGSGLLAGAAGVTLTPLALGGATSGAGAIVGALEDGHKKPAQTAPASTAAPSSGTLNLDPSTWNQPQGQAPVDSSATPPPATTDPSNAPTDSSSQTTTPPSNPSTGTNPAPSDQPKTYTVVQGDTLSGIAKKEGVSLSELEQANKYIGDRAAPPGFTSPWDFIKPGDQIALPKSKGMTSALDQSSYSNNN